MELPAGIAAVEVIDLMDAVAIFRSAGLAAH